MATDSRRLRVIVASLGLVMGCTSGADTERPADPPPVTSAPTVEMQTGDDLRAFLDETTRLFIDQDPEWAIDLGLAPSGALTPRSQEHQAATVRLAIAAQEALIGAAASTVEEELALDVMRWWLEDLVRGSDFRDHEYAASFITGPHVALPEFLIDIHPMRHAGDADDYLKRLEALASVVDQVSANVRRAAESGHLMPDRVREIARWQVGAFLNIAGDRQPLATEYRRRMDEALIEGSNQRESQAASIVADTVIPAYRSLAEALDQVEVRTTAGVWDLPGGADYYRWVLRHHTTMDIEPRELHSWGLAEVTRVRGEMALALEALGYDTADLRRALRLAISDAGTIDLDSEQARSQFIATSRKFVDEVEAATEWMFSQAPQADLIIRRPDPSREGGTGAWYRGPDLSGDRPGIYYLAMGAPVRSAHNHATTTVHEGVPGHHFQLALQAETDMALHQRALVFTGFAEGWALYAERLAWEAGVYDTDPYGNVGRLQMELLRAARVVADTGIHELRWSREEAIDYLVDATGLERESARAEVDRYIVWPGQATAYLVGMDQILEARAEAQEALGEQFDLAGFHDIILGSGSLPLPLLRQAVDRWVAETR